MLKAPAGFEDIEVRRQVGELVVRLIDASLADPTRVEKFSRYNLAQDVFDDKTVMSSLEFIKDIEPYQLPLIRKHGKNLVGKICAAYNNAHRYFGFEGGPQDLMDARESDTHLALKKANFIFNIRQMARTAYIKGRGPCRVTWLTVRKGSGWMGESEDKGDIEYAGPEIEPILPEDFILYPLYATSIDKVRMMGHRFELSAWEIREKIESGEYFSDIDPSPEHQQKETAEEEEDFAPDIYSVIVKLHPGMDATKKMKAYRVTVLKSQQIVLKMADYKFPMPEYFAPGLEYDVNAFWPTHSVASSLFEPQTLYNDARTAQIVGAVASARKTVIITGAVGDMDTLNLPIGSAIHMRGDPKINVIPSDFQAGPALSQVAEDMNREADGISGSSQISQGQLPEASQTATATSGALQGTAESVEEYRQNFDMELIRMVQFIQVLIRRNYKDFAKFHGYRLKTLNAQEWDECFDIVPSGRGPANNPEMVLQQVQTMVGAAQSVGIVITPGTKQINGDELFMATIANLGLHFSTEKIITDAVPSNVPLAEDGLVPPGIEEGLGGGPSPELLDSIASQLPPGVLEAILGAGDGGIDAGPMQPVPF